MRDWYAHRCMIEHAYPVAVPDAYRLTFGAFNARLVNAMRILGIDVPEALTDLPRYTGFAR